MISVSMQNGLAILVWFFDLLSHSGITTLCLAHAPQILRPSILNHSPYRCLDCCLREDQMRILAFLLRNILAYCLLLQKKNCPCIWAWFLYPYLESPFSWTSKYLPFCLIYSTLLFLLNFPLNILYQIITQQIFPDITISLFSQMNQFQNVYTQNLYLCTCTSLNFQTNHLFLLWN